MAEKYVKIPRVIEELPLNEIRVRRDPRIGRYLNRANDLLTGKVEGFNGTIVIKGVQQAMENAVKLAELIKHRFTGLYQINTIDTMETKDEYEPLEEGLDHLTFRRYTTMLTIVLTRDEPEDHSHVGYQDPIPDSEVQPFEQREPRERSVGGRSRLQSDATSGEGRSVRDRSRPRSRSRGRRGNRFTGQRGGGAAGAGAGRTVLNLENLGGQGEGRRRVTNTLDGEYNRRPSRNRSNRGGK